jgi:hypothetical protein
MDRVYKVTASLLPVRLCYWAAVRMSVTEIPPEPKPIRWDALVAGIFTLFGIVVVLRVLAWIGTLP